MNGMKNPPYLIFNCLIKENHDYKNSSNVF